MKGILGIEEKKLTAADYCNDPRSVIVDAASTLVMNGTQLKVRARRLRCRARSQSRSSRRKGCAEPLRPRVSSGLMIATRDAFVSRVTATSRTRVAHTDRARVAQVYAWYDNEWGYSCRLAELARKVAAMGEGGSGCLPF
jgi:glyceraldehyde-3-phosphate dehydrogenase/erythrose-4-phosphate dehydrogenase